MYVVSVEKKCSVFVLARSLKTSGIGRLLVTVTEAQELKACKPSGEFF